MFVFYSCFYFFAVAFDVLAEDLQACSAKAQGVCDGISISEEEGLELLQVKGKKVEKSASKRIDDQDKVAKTSKDEKKEVEDDKHVKHPIDANHEEIESEMRILEASDSKKIRFRAKHGNWLDILELYNDGFFQRYYHQDAGIWKVEGDKLVLAWIRWGEEVLTSADGGETFSAQSKDKPFSLKSYVRPVWWTNRFKNIALSDFSDAYKSDELDSADEADSVNFTDSVNVSAVIAAHRNAWNSDLDERGYQAIATLKDSAQMETFVRRVVEFLGLEVKDEGGLQGLIPFYSGEKSIQSFEKLVVELEYTAHAGGFRWVGMPDKEGHADSDTATAEGAEFDNTTSAESNKMTDAASDNATDADSDEDSDDAADAVSDNATDADTDEDTQGNADENAADDSREGSEEDDGEDAHEDSEDDTKEESEEESDEDSDEDSDEASGEDSNEVAHAGPSTESKAE